MTTPVPVELTADIGFLLSRVGALVASAVSEALVVHGLKVRSYSALALACDSSTGVNQRTVAETIALDPSQVSSLVDDLERRDLVRRITDPSDRRNRLVEATAAGHTLYRRAHRDVCATQDDALSAVPDDVMAALRTTLQSVLATAH
ncbi:MarR family winged helix-turn-helix transcriptional regulator [Gordonia sp. NPDC003424]